MGSNKIREYLFAGKRAVWAVFPSDVGFLRFFYVGMIIWVSLFTAIYAATNYTGEGIRFLTAPLGDFSLGGGMTPEDTLYLLLTTGIIMLLVLLYVLIFIINKPNFSWFELQVVGSLKLKRWDYFILCFGLLLFIGNLWFGESFNFYHLFVFLSAAGATGINLFSKQELDAVVPDSSPEPVTAPEAAETSAALENAAERSYAWKSLAGSFNVDISLSLEEVKKRREQNKNEHIQKPADFADRVEKGLSADVHRLVAEIAGLLEKRDARCVARLDTLLQFVHQFQYISDEDSKGGEYARFPIETLYDEEGDCDCFAILAAALFKLHGYSAALIFSQNHCMAGVGIPENIEIPGNWVEDSEGRKYFVCEATGRGWRIGELSDEHDFAVEEVITV